MLDLILLACSLANPNACREYHMLLRTPGSLRACASQAQPYLAQWVGEHPYARIVRWHCAWSEQEDDKS